MERLPTPWLFPARRDLPSMDTVLHHLGYVAPYFQMVMHVDIRIHIVKVVQDLFIRQQYRGGATMDLVHWVTREASNNPLGGFGTEPKARRGASKP